MGGGGTRCLLIRYVRPVPDTILREKQLGGNLGEHQPSSQARVGNPALPFAVENHRVMLRPDLPACEMGHRLVRVHCEEARTGLRLSLSSCSVNPRVSPGGGHCSLPHPQG